MKEAHSLCFYLHKILETAKGFVVIARANQSLPQKGVKSWVKGKALRVSRETTKKYKETLWGDGYVHCIDCAYGFTGI